MLAAALEAQVDEYIHRHAGQRDEKGHAPVVRNGRARPRTIQCGAGGLQVQAPRVHDRRSDKKFSSEILPPYMHKSPRLEEAVPVLYLRDLSTGDFAPAMAALLGEEAVAGGVEYNAIRPRESLGGMTPFQYASVNAREPENVHF